MFVRYPKREGSSTLLYTSTNRFSFPPPLSFSPSLLVLFSFPFTFLVGSPLSPFFATSASLFLKALAVLVAAGKVDTATADRVRAFLRDNQVAVSANLEAQLLPTKKAKTQPKRMCFVCYCSFQTEFGSCTTHTHHIDMYTPRSCAGLSFEARAKVCKNPIGAALFNLMVSGALLVCNPHRGDG